MFWGSTPPLELCICFDDGDMYIMGEMDRPSKTHAFPLSWRWIGGAAKAVELFHDLCDKLENIAFGPYLNS